MSATDIRRRAALLAIDARQFARSLREFSDSLPAEEPEHYRPDHDSDRPEDRALASMADLARGISASHCQDCGKPTGLGGPRCPTCHEEGEAGHDIDDHIYDDPEGEVAS